MSVNSTNWGFKFLNWRILVNVRTVHVGKKKNSTGTSEPSFFSTWTTHNVISSYDIAPSKNTSQLFVIELTVISF